MATKPHVKLNTSEQKEKPITLKFNYGFGEEEDNNGNERKNYFPMAQAFRGYLSRMLNERQTRIQNRNPSIEVPAHIEYIHIRFFSQFIISEFYSPWQKEFGLLGVHFSKFNHEVLFSITDQARFQFFIENISSFIQKETGEDPNAEYAPKILFIKEFKFLTSADIIQFRDFGSLMNFRLIDGLVLEKKIYDPIFNALIEYLHANGLRYSFSSESHNLEVEGLTDVVTMDIVNNFDIVLNITSALATVIGPSDLNLPERSYGFEVSGEVSNLPIIGIIDTGISEETPLSSIIVQDDRFNITSSSPFSDDTDHGTGIAAMAALGKKAYLNNYRGPISADARLLSIKIIDSSSAYISQKSTLDLLRSAKTAYPEVKIFVLTTCYQHHKRINEDYSSYAFDLDKFAHENDCIITICTANNEDACTNNTSYDLTYFTTEATNLCTPAESMNNITVGAAAHCLRNGNFQGISTSKEFPALYSRKSHIDLEILFPKTKINKAYFKPDVIECGGDYEFGRSNSYIAVGEKASMEVLSSNPSTSFYTNVGTSFSAPLTANVAAQIQKQYPNIRAQSIKALIVNGASLNLIRFEKLFEKLLNKTAGHGLVNEEVSIYSNDNAVTFLIEDEIEPEQLKIFPLNFPEYLINEDLGKKKGILKVTATLCFSFLPVANHQLGYCPIHMAFCFFKNQTGDEIQSTEDAISSLLKSDLRWSQSGRHKSKPIPYANTQKKSFVVNVSDLVNEKGTFKLALNCRINPQLLPGTDKSYQMAHKFSMAITVEETLKKENLTGLLYNEIIECNMIENIAGADLDLEAEA